jgi:hypothetical protein
VKKTRSLHIFLYIKMEDNNNQQWGWTMAVGAIFALYSWMANIIGNIRFRPQQTPPAADATPPHPSKLNLPSSGCLSQLPGLLSRRPSFVPATSPARE